MSNPAPGLRDTFGQSWEFPPLTHPETGQTPAYAWLVFIPGAFTPVCTQELASMNELAEQVEHRGVGLRLIAPDAVPVLRFVAEDLGLVPPLLSDFWPHGAAAQHFDVFDATTGRPLRASVLVDRNGDALHTWVSRTQRSVQEHLDLTQQILGNLD